MRSFKKTIELNNSMIWLTLLINMMIIHLEILVINCLASIFFASKLYKYDLIPFIVYRNSYFLLILLTYGLIGGYYL